MSWLGGLNDSFNQLSSITGQIGGQISNFTKEVLTETADENLDFEVEAKRLAEELKQSEALLVDLKQENSILQRRLHEAELEISTSTIEYEAKLEDKTKEVIILKQKLATNEGDFIPGRNGALTLPSSFSNVSLTDEDEDFHEIISYQQEINRLSRELDEVRQEAEKWKERANLAKKSLSAGVARHNTDALEGKLRELEEALCRESVHHREELRSIQDGHNATVVKYQEEIRKLRILKSDSPDVNSASLTPNDVIHCQEENKKLQSEVNSLKEQMRTRNRQLQMQRNQLQELQENLEATEAELGELKTSRSIIMEEMARMKNEMNDVEREKELHKCRLDEILEGLSKLFSADDIPIIFDDGNVETSLLDLTKFFNDLREERIQLLAENAEFRIELQDLKTKFDCLEMPNANSEEKDTNTAHGVKTVFGPELEGSNQWHGDGRTSHASNEGQNIESDQHHRRLAPTNFNFGTPLGHSSPHIPTARRKMDRGNLATPSQLSAGDLTLTFQALQKQVEDYELEIEQYEQVQSEWQAEKKSLQDLLNRYQNEVAEGEKEMPASETKDDRAVAVEKLKQELEELTEARGALEKETNRLIQEKEQLHVATKNLSEELNASITEAQSEKDQNDDLRRQLKRFEVEKGKLQSAYDLLTQELDKSREEKEDLDQALDALDTQHQDEMAQLLVVRDDLKEKLKDVQIMLKEEQVKNCGLKQDLECVKKSLDESAENLFATSQEQTDRNICMERQIVELKEMNQQLEKTIAESREPFAELKKEHEKVLLLNKEATSSLEESEKKRIETMKQVVEKEEECKILKTRVEELSSRLSTCENDLADTRHKFNEVVKQHDNELEKRKLDLQGKESEITLLKSRLIDKEQESLQTRTKLQDERNLGTTKAFLQEKTAREEELNLEKEKLEERLSSEMARLQNEIEVLGAREKELNLEKEKSEKKFSSEISQLQEEIEVLGGELENAGKGMAQTQSKHEEELVRMQRENQEQIARIQKTCEDKIVRLQSDHRSFRTEAESTNKVYLEKISHLEKLNDGLSRKLEEVEAEDAGKLTRLSQENETSLQNLRQKHTDLMKQYDALLAQQTALKEAMQADKISLESELKVESEQKLRSQKECVELTNMLQKAHEVESSLSTELTALRLELENSNKKILSLSHSLEEKCETKSADSEDLVQSLKAEIDNLKKRLSEDSAEIRTNSSVEDVLKNLHDFSGLEKSDLSKEDIGSLLQLIKERDDVIEMMRQRQSIVCQNTPSATSFVEVKRLEDANRSLVIEKDQILAVVSEKTKENKKLKDEAHKMMSVMAESSAALEKVQQENAALRAKYEGYDKEMTKETVVKLSRLVTEKELEIESLNQKCGTLLEVLQQQPGAAGMDNMVSGQQVQSLIRDKETLTGQVQQLLNERNHLVALLNQRQMEVDAARAEVAKAAEALERDADDNSKLQIDYGNLVHDYDQTEMKLSSVQKELGNLRDKMTKLQGIKDSLLHKLDSTALTQPKLEVSHFQGSSEKRRGSELDGGESNPKDSRKIGELSETLEQKERILRHLNEDNSRKTVKIERLQNDLREKDLLIHSRMEELNRTKKDLLTKMNEVDILRKSVENLREQVAGLSKDCDEARADVRGYSSRFNEKEAESQAFQETNAQLSMLLKEKEYELESAREKCERLEKMTKENQEGQDSETQRLLAELDNSKQQLIAARHERDQVMLALKQKKIEGDKSAEEARSLREKEVKLESELARLRNHLIQVEEAYTQEAVLAEDKVASLREQLEQTKSTQNAVREASELSQQQAESLQEQLRTAHSQRDQAIQQLQLAQEQGMQYATALQKLQVAVERMQREEAANFAEQLDKVKVQLEERAKAADTFEAMTNDLKGKLENANEALKSASRLNSQLELKEENITQLKNIVAEKQLQIDELQDKIHLVLTKNEGMVDKEIIKNLIIGYFTSPSNKQSDILRLIEGVLGFSQDETRKVSIGPQRGGARAWIGGWLGWSGDAARQQRPSMSLPASPRSGAVNESFTQMFVKFLENESVPHQAVRLPAVAMVNEAQQRRKPPLSPGLASVPTPVGFTAAERAGPSVAGRYSPYLLSSSNGTPTTATPSTSSLASVSHPVALHPITPVLPSFAPIINPKSSSEKEILQDILLSGNEKR